MEKLIEKDTAIFAEIKGCKLIKHKTLKRFFTSNKNAVDFCDGHVGLLNEKSYNITWEKQDLYEAVLTLKEFDVFPTQSAIQAWLKKEHNIIIAVDVKGTSKNEIFFGYSVWWYNKRWFFKGSSIEINYTWEDALEEAILMGLDKIKNVSDTETPNFEKLSLDGVKMEELFRPHGVNCGCEFTNSYSPALGCPNPIGKLDIPKLEISEIAKDYCDRYFKGDENHPAYHHAYTAFVNGSKVK